MADGYDALTEKEKETLRLMARGHDAKSAANALSRSVHTINERLRAARRKLAVTSSREAARLVLDREGGPHENLADKDLGGDPRAGSDDQPGRRRKGAWLIGGICMSVLTAALLLFTPLATDGGGSRDAETAARDAAVESAAMVSARPTALRDGLRRRSRPGFRWGPSSRAIWRRSATSTRRRTAIRKSPSRRASPTSPTRWRRSRW